MNETEVSSAVLRGRFDADAKDMAIISKIIKATIDIVSIKLTNRNATLKNRRYVPCRA